MTTETEPRRQMTVRERAWWKELRSVLRRMPKNVEVQARIGEIGIAPVGSREKCFDRDGETDNLDQYEWDSFSVARFDGRDNHL